MEKKQAFHGSDLEKIEKIYGIKKEDIIPFGGNVNPLGISPLLKQSMAEHLDSVCEYPDRADRPHISGPVPEKCSAAGSHLLRIYTGNFSGRRFLQRILSERRE